MHVVLTAVVLVPVFVVNVGLAFLVIRTGAPILVLVLVVVVLTLVLFLFLAVVVLTLFLVLVVAVLTLFLIVVVLALVLVAAFGVLFVVLHLAALAMIVVMLVPRSALAEPVQHDALGPRELEDVGVARERIERLDEKRLEVLAHPYHDVRILECLGVGRTEREGMRRGASRHQEDRPSRSVHDPREQ